MKDERKEFEVAPAFELQQKYGLYAERRKAVKINPDDVPDDLCDLIPFAERFGVICDITRHDLGDKTSQNDKDALSIALRGRHDRINEWLNSYVPEDGSLPDVTNPAAAYFIAMCVFELEENDGPGLPGNPDWCERRDRVRKELERERRRTARSGPPCRNCGKPLRTVLATRCFECGTDVK